MQYFSYQWHITDECDQRCEHCYIFAPGNTNPLYTMDWDDMVHVLDEIEQTSVRFNRKPYLYLTGGDPILHPRFWDLLEQLKMRGIPFTIMGNPFHLDDETCARMADCGCEKYQLSLDGLRETHDFIRKPGSFDATLEKIGSIKRAGITSVVMTTVSATNIAEIPSLVDVVVNAGVDLFAFSRYCPTGGEIDTHMEPLEYRALLDTLHHKFESYKGQGCTTRFALKDHLWTLYRWEEGLFEIPKDAEDGIIYDGCNCANNHITVLPNGDVYACRRMESKVGNVFNNTLYDLFLGTAMDKYRTPQKMSKCADCELLRFCRGCPAVAYGMTGSHLAPDPQCWHEVAGQLDAKPESGKGVA